MTTKTTDCDHIVIEERENEGCIKCGAFADREHQLEKALREAIATIRDYLKYEHDGDPTSDDARLYERDGH